MGLAASQARLLSLTSRIHDVEYQAQMIQSAKMRLALQEDEAYRKYNDALDAESLTFQNLKGDRVKASFYNLCGLGSIGNNIATDKSYVFRDGSDKLIVPSDVYEGFVAFGGSDPYQFAMYMLCGDASKLNIIGDAGVNGSDGINSLEQTFFDKIDNFDNVYGHNKEVITKLVNDICKDENCSIDSNDPGSVQEVINSILRNGTVDITKFFENIPDSQKDNFESLQKRVDEYKYKLYNNEGANMYTSLTGDEKGFNQEKFNYYLKWGKLIQKECAYVDKDHIRGCTCASDYNSSFDIEKDEEALNQMLQSGKISIDMVYIGRNGEVDDKPTSAASDSNLAMTNKSSLDSTELKRAEAEYEKTMRDVQRKDKRYDMDLNKLETERTALTTEYDSVKKVIQDNIERTFKIFS